MKFRMGQANASPAFVPSRVARRDISTSTEFAHTTTCSRTRTTGAKGCFFITDQFADHRDSGTVGNVCSFPNGLGACSAGVCAYSSCTSPYALANNVCTKVDLNSDPKHWYFSSPMLVDHCSYLPPFSGSFTNVCPSSFINGGAAVCTAGVCQTNCNKGYVSHE